MTIANEVLEVSGKTAGAELTRVYHKQHGIDYLWNADPEYWGKHAPVLFPIVGTLRDDTYHYQDKSYYLPRHGFARDKTFALKEQHPDRICFELKSDEESLKHYPFSFTLRICYHLEGSVLTNQYEVINDGEEPMYFSIGGHPAFRLPMETGRDFEDYYLEFEQPGTIQRWTLQNNLINTHPKPFLQGQKILPLSRELFENDAVILKHLSSGTCSLKSRASRHGLTMKMQGFPYFGIWSAPGAPFVCLEPWHGLADSLYHNQRLEEKEGIIKLDAQETWKKSWSISFW